MMKLTQAVPYALLLLWINTFTEGVVPVVTLIAIFMLLHIAAHFAGFTLAMSKVHERMERAKRFVDGLLAAAQQQEGE